MREYYQVSEYWNSRKEGEECVLTIVISEQKGTPACSIYIEPVPFYSESAICMQLYETAMSLLCVR
jgi:hypothetical protein